MNRQLHVERLVGPMVAARIGPLEQLLRRSLAVSMAASRWPLDAMVASTLETAVAPHASTWVATDAGKMVGAVIAEAQREGFQHFVLWIVVDPAHRRRRIGNLLVDALEQSTTAQRLTGMVDLDDPVASAFWRSRGFVTLRGDSGRVRMGRELRPAA